MDVSKVTKTWRPGKRAAALRFRFQVYHKTESFLLTLGRRGGLRDGVGS